MSTFSINIPPTVLENLGTHFPLKPAESLMGLTAVIVGSVAACAFHSFSAGMGLAMIANYAAFVGADFLLTRLCPDLSLQSRMTLLGGISVVTNVSTLAYACLTGSFIMCIKQHLVATLYCAPVKLLTLLLPNQAESRI